MLARGRISSIRCRSRMLADIDRISVAAAKAVTRRREVIAPGSGLSSTGSFQVPALEDQDGPTQDHRRIEQSIKRVLQYKWRAYRLLVRNCADYVERGEVRHQVSRSGSNPARQAVRRNRESPQVVDEASNHRQGARE